MSDDFASPATANGIKWADVKGSLVIIEVLSHETGIQTAYGEADAVRANVSVIDGDLKGEEYRDTLVFPKALQGQLRSRIGSKVIGRVTQGAAKPGQSAPWLLAEATEDDRKAGKEYLAGQTAVTSASSAAPF